jgi:hypothetical protein
MNEESPTFFSNKVQFTFIWLHAFPAEKNPKLPFCWQHLQDEGVKQNRKIIRNTNINTEHRCTEQASLTCHFTGAKRQRG